MIPVTEDRGHPMTISHRFATLAVATAAVTGLAVPTATAAPASTRPAAATTTAPGTTISYRTSQQVMVADHTSGTRGTWARYQWEGRWRGWVEKSPAGVSSIFGSGGVVPASQRVQGTSSTPAGTFGFVGAFGVGNPGTWLPYRTVDSCSWWDEDPSSPTYNRFVENCHSSLIDPDTGEHLAGYTDSLYRQAAVLDYNYYPPQHRSGAGSGAGIFLHYATQYTGGCVAINSHSELDATIAWLNPVEHPKIVIKS